jgi:multidrug efflux pump subunit AcrA (membrane-fusion protein)
MVKNDMNMEKSKSTLLRSITHRSGGRAAWRSAGLLGVALVADLLLSGCKPAAPAEDAPTVTVQVGAAENEPIQLKVIADAVLYPRDQAAIVPKIIAPVKKFYVDRGSRVKAGQLLAELENQDLAGVQLKSQGGYQQAQVTYDMQAQKVQQDIRLAKQTLDAQQKLYDSRQALYKEGAVSAKDVEDANVALTQARNVYELAQKEADLKVAQAQVNIAKGDMANAEAQVNYTKITSPIDGVVTDRPFYTGETPPAGAALITIMDLSEVVARAHISQVDATHLKAGDEANISVPGQGPALKAKVTLVSPALDPNSTTVEVWVQAANPGGRLKPGVSARVTMIGQTVPHAIVAPLAALLTDTDGVTSMIVLDTDNKPHKQKVKIGIRDGGDLQVTDGLKGGERVVTVGAFELDKMDDMTKAIIQVQAPKMPAEEEE